MKQNKPGNDFFDFENKLKELGIPAPVEYDSLEEVFTLITSPSPPPVSSTLDLFSSRDDTDEKALESPAAADVNVLRTGSLYERFDLPPSLLLLPLENSASAFTTDTTFESCASPSGAFFSSPLSSPSSVKLLPFYDTKCYTISHNFNT